MYVPVSLSLSHIMEKLLAWNTVIPIIILCYSVQTASLLALQSDDRQVSSEYLKFVHNARDFSPKQEYDYIVVGGGTAGCPLAATLSANFSVLLVERGEIPGQSVLHQENIVTNLLEANDDDSPAQPFTSEEGITNFRGRVLGGSSMINFGIYSRADEEFYTESGLEWNMDDVKESYQWVEETSAFRPDRIDAWQSSVKEAFVEAGLGPDNGYNINHIIGTKITASTFDGNGTRHGSVEHLNRAQPQNLDVIVKATVEKVIFSTSRKSGLSASGIIYRDSEGKSYHVRVRKEGEIILSAGTLGSPQLLLLSGVGPSKDLSSLNIRVIQHQPYIGQYMADNPRSAISIVPPFRFSGTKTVVVGIPKNGSYIFPLSGVVPFFSPGPASILFPRLSTSPVLNLNVFTLFEKLSRPLSTGSLRLAPSTNLSHNPIVRFNYFSNPADLNGCVKAVQNIGKMLKSQAMEQYKFQDQVGKKYFEFVGHPLPEDINNVAAMEDFCNKTLATLWHYHGGCSVGKVVDRHFKVIGIKALRIVDSSILTASPGTNPQATMMMMGRYVGLYIQKQRSTKGQNS